MNHKTNNKAPKLKGFADLETTLHHYMPKPVAVPIQAPKPVMMPRAPVAAEKVQTTEELIVSDFEGQGKASAPAAEVKH
jgi:hypothetical protein